MVLETIGSQSAARKDACGAGETQNECTADHRVQRRRGKGNPGPGGWGVVIVTPDGCVTELGGYAAHTTNNRMELTGAIEALASPRPRRTGGGLHRFDLRHQRHPRVDLGAGGGGMEDDRGQRRPEPRSLGAARAWSMRAGKADRLALRPRARRRSGQRAGRRDRRHARAARRVELYRGSSLDTPGGSSTCPRTRRSGG